MGSNAPSQAHPLSFMTKLSPTAYIYKPSPSSTSSASPAGPSSSSADPRLIILATWMGARPAHIAKYLLPYRALYPTSPILLLRSEPRHFFAKNAIKDETSPALAFVQSVFSSPENGTASTLRANEPQASSGQGAGNPQVLIHVWSNGGSIVLSSLRSALSATGHLPAYTIIYDSTPGLFHYKAAFLAFTTGLKGSWLWWLAAPAMHLFCAWFWFWHMVVGRGKTGPLVQLAESHNETKLKEKEVRRTYIYSEGDKLVKWFDVEAHGREAQEKGFRGVRLEKFEATEHVAHVKGEENAKRYWGLVKTTWEGF